MKSRLGNEWSGIPTLVHTSNTAWLEDVEDDARRVIGPEELISRLEDLLEAGEIDETELLHYYREGILP
jgi:hypothetical protein